VQRFGQSIAFIELDVDHLVAADQRIEIGQPRNALFGGERDRPGRAIERASSPTL